MPATFLGVRHHSPACARLVQRTIRELRPAHVLVEGPADMNDRMDEVLLAHELPIAIFTSYRDDERSHASWSPMCEQSPEWVALTEGRRAGAEVRFMDLPAWHPAFADRSNRYADAERRHTEAVEQLCRSLALDNVDALWDHLFEIDPGPELGAHLDAFFDLVRGDASASDEDTARESHMAAWVRAAVADAGDRPVVVVSGGFHRPALLALAAVPGDGDDGWPEPAAFPDGAVGGSYLVPFSYKRLDAFDGYQSGMPSPGYYERVWEDGVGRAGEAIVEAVVERLRARRQPVSTADLVGARTLALGLALLRGHPVPGRVDVLDGLVSALVTDALDRPLPWSGRGRLAAGTDPVVVEMVAALSGSRVGRLHPDTPHPPLLHDVELELERGEIPEVGSFAADLATPEGLGASRVLNRLAVLGIPGVDRAAGPSPTGAPVVVEQWRLGPSDHRLVALIEAGSYGATLASAAAAALDDRFHLASGDPALLAGLLFQAALCGLDELSDRVVADLGQVVGTVSDLGGLGTLLATALGLWRHDRLLGAAGNEAVGRLVGAATSRALWLVEGIRGGPAPSDAPRLGAVVAVRDAVVHAEPLLTVDREAVVGVFVRSTGADRPPDLRGASVGLVWSLDPDGVLARAAGPRGGTDVEQAVRAAARPEVLGDFLAGLFALGREQVLAAPEPGVLGLLDEVIGNLAADDFLVALPALRLAFSWFPPREREAIAHRLLERRGLRGSARSLLRLPVDATVTAQGLELEARVDDILEREALLAPEPSA